MLNMLTYVQTKQNDDKNVFLLFRVIQIGQESFYITIINVIFSFSLNTTCSDKSYENQPLQNHPQIHINT